MELVNKQYLTKILNQNGIWLHSYNDRKKMSDKAFKEIEVEVFTILRWINLTLKRKYRSDE